MEPIQILCENLNVKLSKLLIYGEGRAIVKKEGVAFVNEKNEPCAVSDGYDTVLFWVLNNGSPVDEGFGKNKSKRVNNSYVMAINSKFDCLDLILSAMNDVKFLTFTSYSKQTLQVAEQFFGLSQANFETYFMSIEFDVVEIIKPKTCLNC